MSDDINRESKRKVKRVFNRSTGKFDKPAIKIDATEEWKGILGIGKKRGEGALAKRRKKVIDSNVDSADSNVDSAD